MSETQQSEQSSVPTKEERAEAAKERDEAHVSANKDQEEYDKQLLTLAVGSLAIVLGFIKDVVQLPIAVVISLFYLSCICLFTCVLSVLFSYQYSIWVNRKICEHYAYKVEGRGDEKPYPSGAAKRIPVVNLVSGILFALGLVSAAVFVMWNVHVERKLSVSSGVRPSNPSQEERGQFGKIVVQQPASKPVTTQLTTPSSAPERRQ